MVLEPAKKIVQEVIADVKWLDGQTLLLTSPAGCPEKSSMTAKVGITGQPVGKTKNALAGIAT